MAGMVRKLFSSKKTKKSKSGYESDDDYAELNFAPTTSTSTPKPYSFTNTSVVTVPPPLDTLKTPKLTHDETLESDGASSFERPTLKRARLRSSSAASSYTKPFDLFASEDRIYEVTQYQLMKYQREGDRDQEKRKRKRVERQQEQENRVHMAMRDVKLDQPTVADIEKLRRERDQFRREMERYKTKCESLEKKLDKLQKERHQQQQQPMPNMFQPFSNYNFFGVNPNIYQPPMLLQQHQNPGSGPSLLTFGATSSSSSTSYSQSFQMASGPPGPPSIGPSSSDLNGLGPSGPMAPRYPDPIDNSLLFQDDDTSLSDLSNSSKSDISSDDLK